MKVVMLAGGLGTRISEESHLKRKSLIEISGKPILWHVMKIFSAHGVHGFVICCGYKGCLVKYFTNYFLYLLDAILDICHNKMEVHRNYAESWKVTVIDTGLDTMMGGRLLRARKSLQGGRFCLTYGNGISDANIRELTQFNVEHRRRVTVTAIQSAARFGAFEFDGNCVGQFVEKPKGDGRRINEGSFMLGPDVFSYLHDDQDIWEPETLRREADENQLAAYHHNGLNVTSDNVTGTRNGYGPIAKATLWAAMIRTHPNAVRPSQHEAYFLQAGAIANGTE